MTVIHEHDANLAHHFDSPAQQFEAAKLGMWLFLATEILLFGGLFCLYAVLRRNQPEIFHYGSQFLDTRWGIINTTVLIASSMTMALGVTAAQRGQQRLLLSMLVATFLGGAIFMTVKYVEYHHKFHERLVWGAAFYEPPDWAIRAEEQRLAREAAATEGGAGAAGGEAVAHVPDVEHGRTLWSATCRSCHGVAGEGVSGQGKDIRGSAFIGERTDNELVAFITIGRLANDPLNTTGIQMPPRGGNPLLKDSDLLDIVAVLRTLGPGEGGSSEPAPEGADAASPAPAAAFWIPRSSIPLAAAGPAGIVPGHLDPPETGDEPHGPWPHHALDPDRPDNAHLFFGLYFMLTGLHGFHVLAGMGIIGWLTFRAIRRDFGPRFFTPVDLGGLYWHIVDLIWIFLFPLLYLIG
jgi:cytochrome c oxidase subunit 3